jgi:hypothetical protein
MTARAAPFVFGQGVHRLDVRQRRLRRRAVPARRRGWGRGGVDGARPLLGGISEESPLALGDQLAKELEMNLRGGVLAAEIGKLEGQALEAIVEASNVSIVDLVDPELHSHRLPRAVRLRWSWFRI